MNKHETQFDYHDYNTLGYLVDGELVLDKPCKATRKLFDGDWSRVTEADVWNWIHNSDAGPVTFWKDLRSFTTYYPKPNNKGSFVVVECQFID